MVKISHFTVLVVSPEEDLETVLAPFYEQGESDDWFMDEVHDPADIAGARNWAEELRQSGKDAPPEDVSDLEIAEWYHGGEIEEIDGVLYQKYVANKNVVGPNGGHTKGAKWDWWSLGGRWSGALRLKSTIIIKEPVGVAPVGGTPTTILPETGRMGERGVMDDRTNDDPEFFGRADQAQKKDIDLEGMRTDAAKVANAQFDTYEAIVAQHGPLPSNDWMKKYEEIPQAEFEALRKTYWEHPTVCALQKQGLIGLLGEYDPDDLALTRKEFVERARLQAVTGYAFLDGFTGEWHEPGSTGWFGMSSDTPESRMEYLRRVNNIIDDAPDDAWFSMVDCHV